MAGCTGGDGRSVLPVVHSANGSVHSDPGPQAVVDWNVIALATSANAAFNPPLETRNIAIVQAAVYDAVVTITGGYRPYLCVFKATRGASPVSAAATAAHDALVALYPSQKASLDTTYTNYLKQIGPGPATQAGVDVGHQTAATIIARRSMDGSGTIVAYTPGNQPGDWQPTPPLFKPALDPGWGAVTPFLLRRGDQFRPGEPPALTSPTYTRDYVEIMSVGAVLSATRTGDQTATAKFWSSTAAQLWNQAVQQLVVSHRFTIAQAARAFALLNLTGADAIIGAWDAKFTYNQWRPLTAIVNAGSDGNPNTIADNSWTPLLITPPFPDYPAGHATFAGAAESVLTEIFGASPGSFQMASATAPGVIHHYDSFEAVATEVVNARVWGGIHWRTSCTVGRAMGQLIGSFDIH
ncbi:MAG: vanadium-dependent haloperoxidase, partial [Candidatus Eremiobacteraeota bacterium]|nr:vanadium-dependent haloperoxidase [Candidatus Eremiobacteraeota bacterium]